MIIAVVAIDLVFYLSSFACLHENFARGESLGGVFPLLRYSTPFIMG